LNPWVMRRPGAACDMRLYCFCYAGGSASIFMDWQPTLGPSIEVCAIQLPGRGARFGEPSSVDLHELTEVLAIEICKFANVPFAFFGHSLGGLLAFEVARALARTGRAEPRHLFVSACDAAQYRSKSPGYHLLDDSALIAQLAKYNGTPPAVLEHHELMALLLPSIRADFSLVENYQYLPAAPLSMPMTVLAGTEDDVDSPEQVHGWQLETDGPFRVQWFEGGHFFIHDHQQAVMDCIVKDLAPLLAASVRP
jgi:surfactin synthase thioesterase subunit